MIKIRFKDNFLDPMWIMEKSCSIGSSDTNHLTLNHPSIAPLHAKLLNKGDQLVIKEASSSPIYVNGLKTTQQSLIKGDQVQLGDITFIIVDPLADLDKPNTAQWSLIADSNWLTGQEFKINANVNQDVIIGRNAECDITFPGTHLSRRHASVTVNEQSLTLADLKSANGTFVNEKSIKTPTEIRAGDRIRFDVYSFRVFGPGLKVITNQASRPRAAGPIHAKPINPIKTTPKNWKVRPTSPGNREETALKKRENMISWLTAIAILGGFIGLVTYLFTR